VGDAGLDLVTLTLRTAKRLQKKRLQKKRLPKTRKSGCQALGLRYLPRLMPKPIARSKTRKSVSKRFKITGTGKVRRQHASRRHLLSSKSAKRKRHMAKSAEVHKTDTARIKMNMPFG
jgi:large subunit ribosomal protein L35